MGSMKKVVTQFQGSWPANDAEDGNNIQLKRKRIHPQTRRHNRKRQQKISSEKHLLGKSGLFQKLMSNSPIHQTFSATFQSLALVIDDLNRSKIPAFARMLCTKICR